jgi:hypothetical protein
LALARCANRLDEPVSGAILTAGIDTTDAHADAEAERRSNGTVRVRVRVFGHRRAGARRGADRLRDLAFNGA